MPLIHSFGGVHHQKTQVCLKFMATIKCHYSFMKIVQHWPLSLDTLCTSHQPPDPSSNTYELLYPISHRTHFHHIFLPFFLESHQHTSIRHDTTLLENQSDISHSKHLFLPFEEPVPTYHLNKLLKSFIIIFAFE